jgi:hypothetical protein
MDTPRRDTLNTVSWNMAAINNNPFEYWITMPGQRYNALMQKVAKAITTPESSGLDVPVSSIFTDEMFDQLKEKLSAAGIEHLDDMTKYWQDNFRGRKVISEFLKDKAIGSKRLASYPDRYTNTISERPAAPTASHNSEEVIGHKLFRPTVINCYEEENLGTLQSWWQAWQGFMFATSVKAEGGEKKVLNLLQPIHRSKYPAVTEEEESMSVPLQVLTLAIFDATLVSLLNGLEDPLAWQHLRGRMCAQLNRRKAARSAEILSEQYSTVDAMFLQEVGKEFLAVAKASPLHANYDIVVPASASEDRDQNSVLFLRHGAFVDVVEVTEGVRLLLPQGAKSPVSDGDLVGTYRIVARLSGSLHKLRRPEP